MANHPNRGWRSRWSADSETGTVTHRDGWVFQFVPDLDNPGHLNGTCTCITQPQNLTPEQMTLTARLAWEAREMCVKVSEGQKVGQPEKRPIGRPAVLDGNAGGRRVNVYLDKTSLAVAKKLGDGNVSEGIRKALKQVMY